jgi:hypothetical protein
LRNVASQTDIWVMFTTQSLGNAKLAERLPARQLGR